MFYQCPQRFTWVFSWVSNGSISCKTPQNSSTRPQHWLFTPRAAISGDDAKLSWGDGQPSPGGSGPPFASGLDPRGQAVAPTPGEGNCLRQAVAAAGQLRNQKMKTSQHIPNRDQRHEHPHTVRRTQGVWELTFEGRQATFKHELRALYVAYLLTERFAHAVAEAVRRFHARRALAVEAVGKPDEVLRAFAMQLHNYLLVPSGRGSRDARQEARASRSARTSASWGPVPRPRTVRRTSRPSIRPVTGCRGSAPRCTSRSTRSLMGGRACPRPTRPSSRRAEQPPGAGARISDALNRSAPGVQAGGCPPGRPPALAASLFIRVNSKLALFGLEPLDTRSANLPAGQHDGKRIREPAPSVPHPSARLELAGPQAG